MSVFLEYLVGNSSMRHAVMNVHCLANMSCGLMDFDYILTGVTDKYAARVPVPSPC